MRYLIFGGRSPIALALCKQLIETGQNVHLVTRQINSEIQAIASLLKIEHLHECDLQDSQRAIALASEIDALVKGLDGIAFLHRYRSNQPKPLDQYAVEVFAPFKILESLANATRQKELAVVLTSSPAAMRVVEDQDFQYHASKSATEQLVRFASVRFAKSKLRTNGINPGSFVFKERAAEFYKDNPQVLETAKNSNPLGRIASVDEVAAVAMFLLSKSSSFINGQIINVDGGYSNIVS